MKKLIPIIAIFFAACSAPSNDSYVIEGKIHGKSPAQAKLIRYQASEYITIDSSSFTHGEFKFKGSVDYPEMYWVKIGDQRPISLFVENANINVTANLDSLPEAVITGSTTQDEFVAYQKSKEPFTIELDAAYAEYKAATDENIKIQAEAKYDSIDALQTEFIKDYVKNNSASVLAPYIIQREIGYYLDLDELEELANTISPDLQGSTYTKAILEKITLLRSLEPNMPAPEFTQNDTAGNPVHLSDYKGQYLLIDFWASWCSPCRKANPTVVKTYQKYKNKGFAILGVSMDSEKANWLKAIEDDNLTWPHVSTLNGWGNPVGKKYGVSSIPHTILINPEGKIIKRNVHAAELDALLSEYLK